MKSIIRAQSITKGRRIPCNCMRCQGKEMPNIYRKEIDNNVRSGSKS